LALGEVRLGGKKKLSLKQMEKMQGRKSGKKTMSKSVSSPRRPIKRQPGVIMPDPKSAKVISKLKKEEVLTPFTVASHFNIRLSVAKDLLKVLEKRGVIKYVSGRRDLKIYKPSTS